MEKKQKEHRLYETNVPFPQKAMRMELDEAR